MYKLHNIISKFLGSYTKPLPLLLCLLAPLAVYAGGVHELQNYVIINLYEANACRSFKFG